ncbi:hypothetical protein C0993_009353 [Termitomyces sp. T159_Od127]|nr:hypothetical protein C0993_009353 [Termitomyces sp. T159_Od127]
MEAAESQFVEYISQVVSNTQEAVKIHVLHSNIRYLDQERFGERYQQRYSDLLIHHQQRYSDLLNHHHKLQYRLATLSCQSLVEKAVDHLCKTHLSAQCTVKLNNSSTKGVLAHLSVCPDIDPTLKKQIDKMEDVNPSFPPKLAHTLFGDQLEQAHKYMMIKQDVAYIPADLAKAEHHLLIVLAAWQNIDYKLIDDLGADLTHTDPDTRHAFEAMSPTTSPHNSNGDLKKGESAKFGDSTSLLESCSRTGDLRSGGTE